MKRKLLLLFYLQCCLSAMLWAQSISRFEYFFDTDPGVGNGIIYIPGAAADSVTVNIPLDITGLSVGYHKVGLRSMDVNNHWSHTEFHSLYIITPPDYSGQQIVSGEFYFGDTDPGLGNAAMIPIANPADSITVLRDSVLNNLPLGQYKINVRFKDARGKWSHQETRVFTVCNTYGAQSEMIYQVEGNRVFFTNQSLYYDTLTWKFGDNTLDTVTHPIKTYVNAGVYNVQLITENPCGIDTLTQAIEIRGLQRLNANKAGNAGVSTIMFEGFGFTPTTTVKLVLGQQVFVPVTKSFVNAGRIRATFNFDGFATGVYRAVADLGSAFDTLNNALTITGSLPVNLTLDVADGRQFTRLGGVNFPGWVRNNGTQDAVMVPYVVSTGVVPGVSSANMSAFVISEQVPILTQGVFQHTYQYLGDNQVPPDVMFFNNLDSLRNRQVVAYYRTGVPGQSATQERVKLQRFPYSNTAPSNSFQTGTFILGPLLDSYAKLDSVNTDYQACYSAFMKRAVEKQLNITVSPASWNSCFAPAFDTLMRTLVNIAKNPVFDNQVLPMQASFSALLARLAGCGGSGVPANLGGIQFKRIIQEVMNNWIYLDDIDSLDPDCIDTTVQVFARSMKENTAAYGQRIEATACDNECEGAAVFPELCDQCLPLIVAGKVGGKLKVNGHAWGANSAVKGCQEWCETNSIDPNAKYGPGNNADRKYINHFKEVKYTITFENLPTATAPAAFVEIRDTIDKTKFDISTLTLGTFSWGDSIVQVEPNKQAVSILKTLKPAHPNFLRIDAVTDTATGEVRWRFWTLDTVTLQLTNDPFEGFLPPNTDGVSGAGYVTFSIAPWPNLSLGTPLRNKALIIFDGNQPIITNEWEYRIDTLQPLSAVNGLPPITNTSSFTVIWAGNDAHAGISRYSVYVSVNDSAYKVWQSLTEQTSAVFNGTFGKSYKFFSVALDKAGNYEDPPMNPLDNPDAFTMVDAPLPLDLLSFIARKTTDQKKAELIWTTVNEQHVSHFELQRSKDGLNYVTIGRVPAANNPSGHTYTWLDAAPLKGNNSYRVKMVDTDASFKYSPIRRLVFSDKQEIFVFPTVTNDIVFVQSEKQVQALLHNSSGIKLETGIVRGTLQFNLSQYPSGLYFITIPEKGFVYKIIRQ